jgi:hypothetical protein
VQSFTTHGFCDALFLWPDDCVNLWCNTNDGLHESNLASTPKPINGHLTPLCDVNSGSCGQNQATCRRIPSHRRHISCVLIIIVWVEMRWGMGAEIEGRTREEAGGRTSAVVRAVLCLCRLPNELGHKLS